MRRLLVTLGLAAALSTVSWAQGTDDSQPATSNLPGAEYPRVHADLRVTFRVRAPGAKKVQVMPGGSDNGLGRGPFDMQQEQEGVWTTTIAPVLDWFLVRKTCPHGNK